MDVNAPELDWLVSVDDHLIEITLTTILTYGTYLVAEKLHASGVIAVVVAGLVLANVGARHHNPRLHRARARLSVERHGLEGGLTCSFRRTRDSRWRRR